MKYLLTMEWKDGGLEAKGFSAANNKEALLKAFGDPDNLTDDAVNDPTWWFEENTIANMYYHGDPPDEVTLVQVGETITSAKRYMMSVHNAVEKRCKEWDDEANSKKELEELERLAKKHGKQIA